MGTVNDFVGAVGGAILGIELVVVVLLLAVFNAALAYVLWWVLKKVSWAHEKITWATGKVSGAVDTGANIVAAPVIRTTSAWRGLKAGWHRITHWPSQPSSAPTAEMAPPISGPDAGSRAA
jgi:hypothetical protein